MVVFFQLWFINFICLYC